MELSQITLIGLVGVTDRPTGRLQRMRKTTSLAVAERRRRLDGSARAVEETRRSRRGVHAKVLVDQAGLYHLDAAAIAAALGLDESEVRRMVAQECMALARVNGAKVMCLGGLTASLMKYGRLLDGAPEVEGVTVTTGHAVTAVCCVRTFLNGLERAELEPEAEQLTIVGMGSVGAAFLELLGRRRRSKGDWNPPSE